MRASRWSLALLAALLGAPATGHGQAAKGGRDGRNDVVGAIWTFQASHGQERENGQFRVYQHEVFKGPRKVGYVKPKDNDETTLVIDGFPKLNGTVVLRKVGQRPPIWTGVLDRTDGSKWKIRVDVKDR